MFFIELKYIINIVKTLLSGTNICWNEMVKTLGDNGSIGTEVVEASLHSSTISSIH